MNWSQFFLDLQLILLAMILTNSVNAITPDFSWLGLGVMLSGVGLVITILSIKHSEWYKK